MMETVAARKKELQKKDKCRSREGQMSASKWVEDGSESHKRRK